MPIKDEIELCLAQHFTDSQFTVSDYKQDSYHFAVEIHSALFRDKSILMQHKMVKEALKEQLRSGRLHALTIKTFVILVDESV